MFAAGIAIEYFNKKGQTLGSDDSRMFRTRLIADSGERMGDREHTGLVRRGFYNLMP